MSYLCYLLCLMFGSSLPPVVCRRAHVLFMLFVLFVYSGMMSCFVLDQHAGLQFYNASLVK
jgi:hypothetical protein